MLWLLMAPSMTFCMSHRYQRINGHVFPSISNDHLGISPTFRIREKLLRRILQNDDRVGFVITTQRRTIPGTVFFRESTRTIISSFALPPTNCRGRSIFPFRIPCLPNSFPILRRHIVKIGLVATILVARSSGTRPASTSP